MSDSERIATLERLLREGYEVLLHDAMNALEDASRMDDGKSHAAERAGLIREVLEPRWSRWTDEVEEILPPRKDPTP